MRFLVKVKYTFILNSEKVRGNLTAQVRVWTDFRSNICFRFPSGYGSPVELTGNEERFVLGLVGDGMVWRAFSKSRLPSENSAREPGQWSKVVFEPASPKFSVQSMEGAHFIDLCTLLYNMCTVHPRYNIVNMVSLVNGLTWCQGNTSSPAQKI